MSRRLFFRWMAVCMFVMAWVAPVHAQLPGGCSSADQERNSRYTKAAEQALMEGNAGRYIDLLREMESGLSKACHAALNREQPARVRCSVDERNLVLERYKSMMASLLRKDYQAYVRSYENLEASVSSGCWLALNQTQDPRFRRACSASDLDVMASYAGRILRVTVRAIQRAKPGEVPDASELEPILEEQYARVSPRCKTAWDRVIEEAQKAVEAELAQKASEAERAQTVQTAKPRSGGLQMPSRVIDLGGGNFIAPGIGACGPSGCVIP